MCVTIYILLSRKYQEGIRSKEIIGLPYNLNVNMNTRIMMKIFK